MRPNLIQELSGWARIESSFFVAAITLRNGKVTKAAPIVKYMIGWEAVDVLRYGNKRKWKIVFYRTKRKTPNVGKDR